MKDILDTSLKIGDVSATQAQGRFVVTAADLNAIKESKWGGRENVQRHVLVCRRVSKWEEKDTGEAR